MSAPVTAPAGLISVVLCCHNGARTLTEQLAALARQDYAGAWELVFVDDGSTDESAAIASSWADRLPLRIVPTGEPGAPVGLASARNIGGHAARGRRASVLRRRRHRRRSLDLGPRRGGDGVGRLRRPQRGGAAQRPRGPRLALPLHPRAAADRLRGRPGAGRQQLGRLDLGVSRGRRVRPRVLRVRLRRGGRLLLARAAGRARGAIRLRRGHAHQAPLGPADARSAVVPLRAQQRGALPALPSPRPAAHLGAGDPGGDRQDHPRGPEGARQPAQTRDRGCE